MGCTPPTIFAICVEYRSSSTIAIPTLKTARDVLMGKESVGKAPVTVNEAGTMKQQQMTQCVTALSVFAALSLLAACSSESSKALGAAGASSMGGATGTGGTSNTGGAGGGYATGDASTAFPACPSPDPSYICQPSGFPFIQIALVASDLCGGPVAGCALGKSVPTGETTATLSQPAAGKLCLSGVVSPGGWAQLGFEFIEHTPDGTGILKMFDANALGISQLRFTVDTPPSGGLTMDAAIDTNVLCPSDATHCSCRRGSLDCFTYGFDLMTAAGSSVPENITTAQTVTAPFANFKQTVDGHSFDTSAIDHMELGLTTQGPFNFCMHDFNFLDAQGNVVLP